MQQHINTSARMMQNANLPKDVSSAIARLDINELVVKAQIELNDMIFVCKRYDGMNREILGKARVGLLCSLTKETAATYEEVIDATSKEDR